MAVFLAILVAAIVLFVAFGPILRRGSARVVLDPDAFRERSGRLEFRRPYSGDLAAIEEIFNDPELLRANHWNESTSEEMATMLASPAAFEKWARTTLVGVRRRDDAVVGATTLSVSKTSGRKGLAIGIAMHPDFRGQGLATELMAAMIFATQDLTTSELWVATAITNQAVPHIMSGLGYVPEPETPPFSAPDGTSIESFWYRVGRDAAPPAFSPPGS